MIGLFVAIVLAIGITEERSKTSARPDLDTVLREVNRIRASRGLDAVYELPPGRPVDPQACAIARALGGDCFVSPYGIGWDSYPEFCGEADVPFESYDHPIRRFVVAFTHGEYPELIAP